MDDRIKDLIRIPGVGPNMARKFLDIGINRVTDLEGRDPEELYRAMCEVMGAKLDRCVLYVCRSSVYFAGHPKPDPDKLKWWYWKDGK